MIFELSSVARDLDTGAVVPALLRLHRRLGDVPTDIDALFVTGIAEGMAGRNPLKWHLRCLAVYAGHPGAAANAAAALTSAGRAEPATRILRRLLVHEPGSAPGHGNLGMALLAIDVSRAPVVFARVLAIAGADPQTLVNLGAALERLGRKGEAARAYRRAAVVEPAFPSSLYNLALINQGRGEVERTILLLRRVLALAPDDAFVHSNLIFALTYRADACNRGPAAEARRWAARHARVEVVGRAPWPNTPIASRRLRIGYLSSDLRTHSVTRNLEGLFRHHDHAAVEVAIYSATPNPDATTDRLKRFADIWRDVATLDDRSIADRIHADQVDIFVNIGGHTGHNRPRVPAFRAAPIQASLFDLGTTGMAEVDYWFTDVVAHPEGAGEPFVEKLERLPVLVVHEPPEDAPPVGPLPAMATGRVTFASFNNPAKLSGDTLALWGRILRAVPTANLLLKYGGAFVDLSTRRRHLDLFAGFGIEERRIAFASGSLDQRTHLSLLGGADIALDPFPFNGSTTTFEALWMGLPVVALAGSSFLSRMAMATLVHAGYPELVAADADDYVRLAVDLARDPPRLATLRREMRARVAGSALCRPEPYARSLEAAYRRMWEAWCRSNLSA